MHLLDLPHELLSYIMHFADYDTLRTLCLTEKRNLYHIARHFLWRNVTVIFDVDQKPKPNLFSFDSGHLSAIRSLSAVVDGYLDISLSSFYGVAGLWRCGAHRYPDVILICAVFWDLSLSKIWRYTDHVCLSVSDPAGTNRDAGRSGRAYRHNITETNRHPS
ncbi:uncharacterized protein ARMOST_21677 [Armillaria ostoyae]|uniref:F-box domain-containing protein n=1 Tax=Armillaria ostoyae TaxID=47428 RepID=A0A284SAW3_ARMOS|nr:uncharacterized protein ARMOST_21677 [Armillaria ostoyae]